MWNIDYYHLPASNRCPVEEFLDGLSEADDIPFILKDMDRLSAEGYRLGFPIVRYLKTEKLYELRTNTKTLETRIFFFFFDGNNIIMTNGCKKKTQKLNKNDVALAKKYKKDFFQRGKK